jgi:hypothetical protein
MTPREVEELYGDDKELTITCPRCARQFQIGRDDLRTEH